MFNFNPEELEGPRPLNLPVLDLVFSSSEKYRPTSTKWYETFEETSCSDNTDNDTDSKLSESTKKDNDAAKMDRSKRCREIVDNSKNTKVTRQEQDYFNRTSPSQLREFQKSIPGLERRQLGRITPQLIKAAVDQAVKDMCSDKHGVRQKGQVHLEAMGPAARMSLALALHQMETSKDPTDAKLFRDNKHELLRRTKSVLESLVKETALHVVDTESAIRRFRTIGNTAEGPMIESAIFRTPEQKRLGLEIADGHRSVEKLPRLQKLQEDVDNLPGDSSVKKSLQQQCTGLVRDAATIRRIRPEILMKAIIHEVQRDNPDAASRYAISILSDNKQLASSENFCDNIKLIDEHSKLSGKSRTALREAYQKAGGDPKIFNRQP